MEARHSRYPIEAFALTMVVFSANMKEAFVSGVLVLAATTLAMFVKNLLAEQVPKWSQQLCTLILTVAVCSSSFVLAFYTLNLQGGTGLWVISAIIGAFVSKHVIRTDLEDDYNGVFYQAAICYGILIIIGIVREIFSFGTVFEYEMIGKTFVSKSLQNIMFGIVAAGIGSAVTNQLLGITVFKTNTLILAGIIAAIYPPFIISNVPEIISSLLGIMAVITGLYSIQKKISFSNTMKSYRKLPIELLSVGFLYMILSVF